MRFRLFFLQLQSDFSTYPRRFGVVRTTFSFQFHFSYALTCEFAGFKMSADNSINHVLKVFKICPHVSRKCSIARRLLHSGFNTRFLSLWDATESNSCKQIKIITSVSTNKRAICIIVSTKTFFSRTFAEDVMSQFEARGIFLRHESVSSIPRTKDETVSVNSNDQYSETHVSRPWCVRHQPESDFRFFI